MNVLGAFRVKTDYVDARLTAAGHALRVRQDGLTLEVLGRDTDPDLGWSCAHAALLKINPDSAIVEARYQHLEPLDGPFDVAVRAARDRFLAVPDGEEIVDWAMIVNLRDLATAEFGIIRDTEAIPRLTRSAGGMKSSNVQNAQGFWQDVRFPEVALFADSHWPSGIVGDKPDEARDAWGVALGRANDLAEHLYAKLTVAV
jgi:hypothetical protein